MTGAPTTATPHDGHDRLLIVAYASGDTAGDALVRADVLVATCEGCRGLAADLRAVVAAVASMPPPRPPDRDFRIAAVDADRLSSGAGWRRILRALHGRRGSALGPIAATFMTLGLAGLLFSAGSAFAPGFADTGGADEALAPVTASGVPIASDRESIGGLGYGSGPSEMPTDKSIGGHPPSDIAGQPAPDDASAIRDRRWLVAVSGLLLLAGIGAFGLRRLARRER